MPGVVSHPEFLREGKAVDDFMEPDRIVVGAYDRADAELVASLYRSLETEVVITDPTSAEMIKYASNSYLAARLTFVNTLANVCEAVGADVLDVIQGMGLDHRIGPHFLQPGPGYGGSCFPKDTAALIGVAEDAGYEFDLLKAVIEADHEQRRRIVEKVRQAAGGGLRGRRVCLWGVAFKAGTDDVRESPALRIARLLIEDGAEVVGYDPEATTTEFAMADDPIAAAEGADVLLVATEWPEFGTLDMNRVAVGHERPSCRRCPEPPRLGGGTCRRAGLLGFGPARRLIGRLAEHVLVDGAHQVGGSPLASRPEVTTDQSGGDPVRLAHHQVGSCGELVGDGDLGHIELASRPVPGAA